MRSYGIAKYATMISQEEAMQLLSNIAMGINMDYIKDVSLEQIRELIENIGINTLRINMKDNFSKEEENIKRAEYIKSSI